MNRSQGTLFTIYKQELTLNVGVNRQVCTVLETLLKSTRCLNQLFYQSINLFFQYRHTQLPLKIQISNKEIFTSQLLDL